MPLLDSNNGSLRAHDGDGVFQSSLDNNIRVPTHDGDGLFQVSNVAESETSMTSIMNQTPPPPLNRHEKETEMTQIQAVVMEEGTMEQAQPSSFGGSARLQSVELEDEDNGVGVGSSLPTPDEIRATVNPRSSQTGQTKRRVLGFCGCLTLMALVALSVGLGVGLANRDDNEDEAQKQTRKSRPEAVQLYLIEKSISREEDFDESSSPQSLAAAWLATQDELNYAIPNVRDDFKDSSRNKAAYDYVLRYIMAVVYFSTGGKENWIFQYNFLTGLPTCDWHVYRRSVTGVSVPYGLICNDSQAFALYLDNQFAAGSLPRELGLLDTLVEINLNYNQELSGTIPSSICDIDQLRFLSVGFTSLKGTLPPCINELVKLELLFLPNNDLNGQLPLMTNMTSLERIHLDDNEFDGDISTTFDNMLELQYLFLEDNNFSGTINDSFLRQNTKLRFIDISDNPLLQGTLPVHLFEFLELKLIDMHGCGGITGPFPVIPAPNYRLGFLAFQECYITGPIPSSLNNLAALSHLDLSGNKMTGEIPSELGDLIDLKYLFLSDNARLKPGYIPASFAKLVHMEEFSVKRTKRFGDLPEFISTWTNLTLLDLGENSFAGTLPSSYGNLTNLEFFLVNGNGVLDGEVPDSYKNLVKLRALFLEDNGFAGDLGHMCTVPTFPGLGGDGTKLLVADCDGGGITCECCVCCDPDSPDDADNSCNDNDVTPNLSPQWENDYKRTVYTFGNNTRFGNY